MHILVLQILCFLFGNELALSASESVANNPVFNLDHTALEKNIAAIFNKVAHSSATTKRSVPAYEAQISQSATHSTSPSPATTSLTTSLMVFPMVIHKVTNPPLLRELPSYAPPSRALFTPPLPPEYANPFADKPTLRGTNIDIHTNNRRPVPPPSLTPAHERIPIKPPDLIEDSAKIVEKELQIKDRTHVPIKDAFEMSDREKDSNDTIDFVPSLHFTSISRILSGSNGRKQDIPEILLKPISTKPPPSYIITKSDDIESPTTLLIAKQTVKISESSTPTSFFTLSNINTYAEIDTTDNNSDNLKNNNELYKTRALDIVNNEKLPHPQAQPPAPPSRMPDMNDNQHKVPQLDVHPYESSWKIAWSLHVYVAATVFTLIALYSVYKIVRFNNTTNLLTQSYFLTIHLLLTIVCTLRCFHLFYDAYNFSHSLPETLSRVLMFLPSSLLAAAFATLILYMSRCSTSPSLYQNKILSPVIITFAFTIHITLCISLHVSGHIFGYVDESKLLPLICQCIYILICVTLGLCYMYVYRVIRSQLHLNSTKSVNNHVTTDFTSTTLNTAITTTVATALLFILMGFIQLYGIFGVRERLQPYAWLWWAWQFSVRLIELSMCSLLAWVASLSQYQFREKQLQQHVVHSGFALFPCGSSTSTENMDDALYPAICSTNQAIQNYTIRTGKQVYDDSFPLSTLPDHLNVTSTFERHPARNTDALNRTSQGMRSSFTQRGEDTQKFSQLDNRNKNVPIPLNIHDHSTASGSTMLVAEDGFVRFRNLGSEEDISESLNVAECNNERRSSITCSDKFNVKQPTIITQMKQNFHQNSLPHLHLSLHRNQHQIYNNT